MSEQIAIPSIDSSVASSVAELRNPVLPPELAVHLKQPEAEKPPEKAEKAPEPVKEPQRGLDDIAELNDDAPEPVKALEPAADEPREGEKPAAFIKRLKAEKDAALNTIKQLQEQANKKLTATPDEIAALRKEIEERDALLETTAFERTTKFKEQYVKPVEKAETSAKELIAKFTETKGVYERALALDGKDRAEYLSSELGESAAAVALVKLDRVDEAIKDRNEVLENRSEIANTLNAERENSETAKIVREFDGQREDLAKRLSPFRSENADQLWNQARSLITGEAERKTILSAAALAVVAPIYIQQNKALQAKVAALEARIAEDGADRAKIDGRGSEAAKTSGVIKNGKLPTIDEVIAAGLANA